MVRLLCVDAGFVATGWVVFDLLPGHGLRRLHPVAAGCVRTEKGTRKTSVRVADDDARRGGELARAIGAAARSFKPHALVAELPSAGAQGARANRSMGLATGVLVACAELLALPAEWVTPGMVKKAAGGRQDTSKEDMMAAAETAWPDLRLLAGSGGKPAVKVVFEHVADAAWAGAASLDCQMLRTLGLAVSA